MIRLFFKRFADLVLGIIITTIFALTALVPEPTPVLNAANIILAPFFLGFIPGYALVSTMYPAQSDITTTVRYILAILWSLMLAPLAALALYFSPIGLEIRDWKLLIGALVVYLFFIGIIQRTRTPLEERFQPVIWITPEISLHRRLETNTTIVQIDRVRLGLLLSTIILLCSIIYAVFAFERHAPYTEFYVQIEKNTPPLTAPSLAAQRPSAVVDTLASNAIYDLWIVNRENRRAQYTVAQKTGVEEATYVSSFTLTDNEQKQVRITLTNVKTAQESIIFLLFIDDDSTPYRTISFIP